MYIKTIRSYNKLDFPVKISSNCWQNRIQPSHQSRVLRKNFLESPIGKIVIDILKGPDRLLQSDHHPQRVPYWLCFIISLPCYFKAIVLK